MVRAHETGVRSRCFNLRLRRQAPHLSNDPPAGNHTQDFGPSRTPFASASTGACGLAGTSFRLRIIVLLPTIENSCAHPSHHRPARQRLFSSPALGNSADVWKPLVSGRPVDIIGNTATLRGPCNIGQTSFEPLSLLSNGWPYRQSICRHGQSVCVFCFSTWRAGCRIMHGRCTCGWLHC